MNTLRADLHVHSKYSIEPRFVFNTFEIRAVNGPEKIIDTAIRRGINVLAVTDHDTVAGGVCGEKYVRKKGIENFTFIKGEEITTDKGHLLGIGIEETIKPGLSPEETADRIREQGGVVVVPHPYTHYGIKEHTLTVKADAIEVFNPRFWISNISNLRKGFYEKLAKEHNFGRLSNTDAHTLSILGKAYSELRCEHGTDNVLKAIRMHRTEKIKTASVLSCYYDIAKALTLFPRFWRRQDVL